MEDNPHRNRRAPLLQSSAVWQNAPPDQPISFEVVVWDPFVSTLDVTASEEQHAAIAALDGVLPP